MASTRELNTKQTFWNELLALPRHVLPAVTEKVTRLLADPLPDGDLKKKLKGQEGVYRLKVGDYRILYTFGDTWIRLLCIRPRRDVYENLEQVTWEGPEALPPQDAPDSVGGDGETRGVAVPAAPDYVDEAAADAGAAVTGTLPQPITSDWLTSLNIPAEYHQELAVCTDEARLLDAPVPMWVLDRVLDNIWERPLAEVIQQPDYVVNSPEDLERFAEGDLLGFLLKLDDEQAELASWRLNGPAIIKGGPGTGKSTVALYRVKSLLDRAEAAGQPAPRILVTTYTNALTRFSEQLLKQLLGHRAHLVTVATADHLARTIVERVEKVPDPIDPQSLTAIVEDVRARFVPPGRNDFEREMRRKALGGLRVDFLLAEFEWIIEGRSLTTLDQYLAADRSGRGIPLNAGMREAVWHLYQNVRDEIERKGLTTYWRVRNRALDLVRSDMYRDRFDAVIIDEAQDLTPAALALLVEVCRDHAGLYLTADASQSLYSRGFTWARVHEQLQLRGRTALLRRNYRTSRAIAEAASAFLRETGAGDPECLGQDYVHDGPRPVLYECRSAQQQWQATADFIRDMARRFRLPTHAAAVLVPSKAAGEQAAVELTRLGLPARFMKGTELDLSADVVKVLTLHSAKGLEFPIVVIHGLREGTLPRIPRDMPADEAEEETQAYRRLLFVGITRAMRALMVAYPWSKPSPFVAEFAPALWSGEWREALPGS